jgi:hypothetical protein
MGRKLAIILSVIVAILLVIRLALPRLMLDFVNNKLENLGEYGGHVSGLDLHILSGYYAVSDVNITKKKAEKELPLLRVANVQFSIDWGHLFRGELVGSVLARDLHVNIVTSAVQKEKEVAEETDLQEPVRRIFPVRIDSFELINGTLNFYNPNVKPKIHLVVDDINVSAQNLTNSLKLSDRLVSSVKAKASVLGDGKVNVDLKLNPLSEAMYFDLNAKVTNVNLKKFNSFGRYYLDMDVEEGRGDLIAEIACVNNKISGYIKPIARDLNVADFKQDVVKDKDSFWTYLKELFVGGVAEVAENQKKDQLATRIPVAGTVKNPHTSVWIVLKEVFLNAARRPLAPNVERTVDFNTVKREDKTAH